MASISATHEQRVCWAAPGEPDSKAAHVSLRGQVLDMEESLTSVLGPTVAVKLQEMMVSGGASEAIRLTSHLLLRNIELLEAQVRESEGAIRDLQDEADNLDGSRRLWLRRAELVERERVTAVGLREDAEAHLQQRHHDIAPLLAQFMESEVLRSELEASSDELLALHDEFEASHQKLEAWRVQLVGAEDVEAQCVAALIKLEEAHANEAAAHHASGTEILDELRAAHAARCEAIQAASTDQITALRSGSAEDVGSLEAALDAAVWEAEVYVREQQDAVRETCLRQRDNARLARSHNEARQEALELIMELEILKMAEAGASPWEAEIQHVRQRHARLLRSAEHWSKALERKQKDCEAWRRRATQGGVYDSDTEERDTVFDHELGSSDDLAASSTIDASVSDTSAPSLDFADWSTWSRPSSPGQEVGHQESLWPWSSVPAPTKPRRTTPSDLQHNEHVRDGRQAEEKRLATNSSWKPTAQDPPEPAEQYVLAVLRCAQIRADVEATQQSTAHSGLGRLAFHGRYGNRGDQAWQDFADAEQDVEMLAFLLGDDDIEYAEELLHAEARQSRPSVARELREHASELAARQHVQLRTAQRFP